MKPKLHHINFSTKNVTEMTKFYKEILLLESDPQLLDGKNRFLREAINDYQRTSLAEMS